MGSSPRSCSCTISPRIPDSRTSLVELYSALDNLGLLIEGIPSEVKSSVTKITGERRLSFSITKISRHHIKAKIYEGPLWGMALKSDHRSDMESKISLALSMFAGRWIPACVAMFPRKATSHGEKWKCGLPRKGRRRRRRRKRWRRWYNKLCVGLLVVF